MRYPYIVYNMNDAESDSAVLPLSWMLIKSAPEHFTPAQLVERAVWLPAAVVAYQHLRCKK